MAIKSAGGALPHPLYDALTALKTGQGDLGKVTHSVAVETAGKGRHVLWNLYWNYDSQEFTRTREFGKTIWLCWHYTAYMGGPCSQALRDRNIKLLGELLAESIAKKVRRNTRDLVAFHIIMDWSKRSECGATMGIIDGAVTPEWLLNNTDEAVVTTWAGQAGKGLRRRLSGYKWDLLTESGMSRHPIFEQLIDRLERELDAKWAARDVTQWSRDDMTNLVYKYGRGTVVDAIVDYGIQGILAGRPQQPLKVALVALEEALITAMFAPEHRAYGLYPSLTKFFKVAAHYMDSSRVEDHRTRRLISEHCYLNTAPFCVSMDVLWVAGGERDSASYDVLVLDQGQPMGQDYHVLASPMKLKVFADRGAYDKLLERATEDGLDTERRLHLVELQDQAYKDTLVVPKSAVNLIKQPQRLLFSCRL